MDVVTGIIIILAFYLWAFFLDRFFKSCSHYAYIQFLKGTGLEVKFLQVRWSTSAFNGMLEKWGTFQVQWTNIWFQFGLFTSLITLPIAIYFLMYAFLQHFDNESTGNVIEPVLPGVNIPASEMGYYSMTMLISSILHELGHALAAAQEDVNIIDVGANLIFILPVAYVNLGRDKLFSINPWKRLKILCAGIWHNLVLAFLAYLLLISLPYTLSPLFMYNQGVYVSDIVKGTAIHGGKGLNLGDTLLTINNCEIRNEEGWFKCLTELKGQKPSFCISEDTVHNLDESSPLKHVNGLVSCCSPEGQGKLCFEFLDVKDGILELPPYVCLPGRKAIELSNGICTNRPNSCPENTHCFKPMLANNTNLFRISRNNFPDVIYIGPVSDLARWVTISPYVPKLSVFTSSLADVVSTFLKYVVMFSLGLAFVNILPCTFMDGQYISNTLLHIAFSSHLRTTHINIISGVLTATCTFLLVLHCLIVIKTKLY